MKASGVSEEVAEKAKALMGWPATEEDYLRAAAVIPENLVEEHHGRRHVGGMPCQVRNTSMRV